MITIKKSAAAPAIWGSVIESDWRISHFQQRWGKLVGDRRWGGKVRVCVGGCTLLSNLNWSVKRSLCSGNLCTEYLTYFSSMRWLMNDFLLLTTYCHFSLHGLAGKKITPKITKSQNSKKLLFVDIFTNANVYALCIFTRTKVEEVRVAQWLAQCRATQRAKQPFSLTLTQF